MVCRLAREVGPVGDRPHCPIFPERPLAPWVDYAVAVALIAAVSAIVVFVTPVFPEAFFRVPYVLVIGMVAYFFGIRPAVVAFVLSLASYIYFQHPPKYSVLPLSSYPGALAELGIFTLGCAATAFSMAFIRRTRKRLQRLANDLAESQAVLDAFFSESPALLLILDAELRVFKVNPPAARYFGFPAEQLRGRPLEELMPELTARLVPHYREVLLTGVAEESMEVSAEIPPGSGNVKHWLASRFPIRLENGEVIGVGVTAVDITARVQAEESLRTEQEHRLEFYRRTIMSATDGKLVITDRAEIQRLDGEALASWTVASPEDGTEVRHALEEMIEGAGVDEIRALEFLTAVGEALTNTLKHAGSGTAALYRRAECLLFVAEDQGPGIPALSLPEVALKAGYSTAGTLGMGFKVMMAYTDRVYLATGPAGTSVGLELAISPPTEEISPTAERFFASTKDILTPG